MTRSSSRTRSQTHRAKSTAVYSSGHSYYEKNRKYFEAISNAVADYMSAFRDTHIELCTQTDVHRNTEAVLIPFTLGTLSAFDPQRLGEDISERADAKVTVILEPNPTQASNFNMSFSVAKGTLGRYGDDDAPMTWWEWAQEKKIVIAGVLVALLFVLVVWAGGGAVPAH